MKEGLVCVLPGYLTALVSHLLSGVEAQLGIASLAFQQAEVLGLRQENQKWHEKSLPQLGIHDLKHLQEISWVVKQNLSELIHRMSPEEQLSSVFLIHSLNKSLIGFTSSLEQLQQSPEVAALAALLLDMGQCPEQVDSEQSFSRKIVLPVIISAMSLMIYENGLVFIQHPLIMEAIEAMEAMEGEDDGSSGFSQKSNLVAALHRSSLPARSKQFPQNGTLCVNTEIEELTNKLFFFVTEAKYEYELLLCSQNTYFLPHSYSFPTQSELEDQVAAFFEEYNEILSAVNSLKCFQKAIKKGDSILGLSRRALSNKARKLIGDGRDGYKRHTQGDMEVENDIVVVRDDVELVCVDSDTDNSIHDVYVPFRKKEQSTITDLHGLVNKYLEFATLEISNKMPGKSPQQKDIPLSQSCQVKCEGKYCSSPSRVAIHMIICEEVGSNSPMETASRKDQGSDFSNSEESQAVVKHKHLPCDIVDYDQSLPPPTPTPLTLWCWKRRVKPLSLANMQHFISKVSQHVLEERDTECHETICHAVVSVFDPEPAVTLICALKKRSMRVFNCRDKRGNTPLHNAVMAGNLVVVENLIDIHPETVYISNNDGATPIDSAMHLNNHQIVECLLHHVVTSSPHTCSTNTDQLLQSYLLKAMKIGYTEYLRILLELHSQHALAIDFECTDSDQHTAWFYLQQKLPAVQKAAINALNSSSLGRTLVRTFVTKQVKVTDNCLNTVSSRISAQHLTEESLPDGKLISKSVKPKSMSLADPVISRPCSNTPTPSLSRTSSMEDIAGTLAVEQNTCSTVAKEKPTSLPQKPNETQEKNSLSQLNNSGPLSPTPGSPTSWPTHEVQTISLKSPLEELLSEEDEQKNRHVFTPPACDPMSCIAAETPNSSLDSQTEFSTPNANSLTQNLSHTEEAHSSKQLTSTERSSAAAETKLTSLGSDVDKPGSVEENKPGSDEEDERGSDKEEDGKVGYLHKKSLHNSTPQAGDTNTLDSRSDLIRFTPRGDSDTILQAKAQIEMDDILKAEDETHLVMVEGAPGKSTIPLEQVWQLPTSESQKNFSPGSSSDSTTEPNASCKHHMMQLPPDPNCGEESTLKLLKRLDSVKEENSSTDSNLTDRSSNCISNDHNESQPTSLNSTASDGSSLNLLPAPPDSAVTQDIPSQSSKEHSSEESDESNDANKFRSLRFRSQYQYTDSVSSSPGDSTPEKTHSISKRRIEQREEAAERIQKYRPSTSESDSNTGETKCTRRMRPKVLCDSESSDSSTAPNESSSSGLACVNDTEDETSSLLSSDSEPSELDTTTKLHAHSPQHTTDREVGPTEFNSECEEDEHQTTDSSDEENIGTKFYEKDPLLGGHFSAEVVQKKSIVIRRHKCTEMTHEGYQCVQLSLNIAHSDTFLDVLLLHLSLYFPTYSCSSFHDTKVINVFDMLCFMQQSFTGRVSEDTKQCNESQPKSFNKKTFKEWLLTVVHNAGYCMLRYIIHSRWLDVFGFSQYTGKRLTKSQKRRAKVILEVAQSKKFAIPECIKENLRVLRDVMYPPDDKRTSSDSPDIVRGKKPKPFKKEKPKNNGKESEVSQTLAPYHGGDSDYLTGTTTATTTTPDTPNENTTAKRLGVPVPQLREKLLKEPVKEKSRDMSVMVFTNVYHPLEVIRSHLTTYSKCCPRHDIQNIVVIGTTCPASDAFGPKRRYSSINDIRDDTRHAPFNASTHLTGTGNNGEHVLKQSRQVMSDMPMPASVGRGRVTAPTLASEPSPTASHQLARESEFSSSKQQTLNREQQVKSHTGNGTHTVPENARKAHNETIRELSAGSQAQNSVLLQSQPYLNPRLSGTQRSSAVSPPQYTHTVPEHSLRDHKDRIRTSAELLHAQDYPRIFPIAYEGKPPHTLPPELRIPYIFITGLAYYKLSSHKKSVQYFQQCLQLAEECGRDGDMTICCIYIGDIEFAQRKYNEAAERYQKALHYYSRDSVAKDFRMILPTQSALWSKCGSAFKNASKMADSITAYDQAIEQATSKKDKLAAHTSLGNLYQGIGENGRAVKEYEDAIQLAAELDDKVSLGWNHGNLGNALLGLYQRDKALHHLFKALDMAVEHETTPQAIGRAYNNLGTAYQAINDYSEAEKHYDLALAQAIYGNDIPGQARVYGNIGNLQMLKKEFDRAVPHYTEVMRLSQDKSTVTTAHHNRGCAYYDWAEKKKMALSERSSQKGSSPFKVSLHGPQFEHSEDDRPMIIPSSIQKYYLQGTKDLEYVMKHHEESFHGIKGSSKGLSLSVSLFETNSRTFHRMQDCLIHLKKSEDEPSRFEDALLVAEQSRARTLGELLLKRRGPQLKHQLMSPPSLAQLKSIVARQSCPVVYLSYTGERLLGWVLVPTTAGECSLNMFEVPLSDSEFDGKSFDYHLRYSLNELLVEKSFEMYKPFNDEKEQTDPVKKLYNLVARPLMTMLNTLMKGTRKEVQKIIIVPDSYTNLLPYACLLNDVDEKFWGDEYYFQIMPSLLTMGILDQLPTVSVTIPVEHQQMICVVGNPTIPPFKYNDDEWNLGKLPHATKEAEWVAHILKCKPILHEQATKDAVIMRAMNAKVIHLATHGSAVAGFLAFAGISASASQTVEAKKVLLYPEEVENLNITPALVVLSSCDSGRGVFKADGIQGMARAFILAGAQAVLTTLWRVPDESACIFMQFFYQYLVDGVRGTEALHNAMLSVRCFSKYSQYIHWSGYQLTGREIQFTINQSSSAAGVTARLGNGSIFPQLDILKKLEGALLNNPRLPTDVQVLFLLYNNIKILFSGIFFPFPIRFCVALPE